MVDKDKLRQKIQFIRREVRRLQDLRNLSWEEFKTGPYYFDASLRMLQVAIEAMIDICNHIVAREGLGLPRNYRDGFHILAEHKIIEPEMLNTYIRMTKFRNRIVHLYDEVNIEEVYEILRNNLPDFDRFIASIVKVYFNESS